MCHFNLLPEFCIKFLSSKNCNIKQGMWRILIAKLITIVSVAGQCWEFWICGLKHHPLQKKSNTLPYLKCKYHCIVNVKRSAPECIPNQPMATCIEYGVCTKFEGRPWTAYNSKMNQSNKKPDEFDFYLKGCQTTSYKRCGMYQALNNF